MFFWFSSDRSNARYLPGDYDVLPDDGTRSQWIDAAKRVSPKLLCYIDARAEKVFHEYARSILEHVNPYTGKRYADEETIALYEIHNENPFVQWLVFGGGWAALPKYCRDNVTRRWNDWLRTRYKTDAGLRKAWGRLRPGESLRKGTVAYAPLHRSVVAVEKPGYVQEFISKDKSAGKYPYARGEDVVRFACDLYQGFNRRFVKFVRSLGKPGIGIRVAPITSTGCYGRTWAAYYAAADGDFVSVGIYGFAYRGTAGRAGEKGLRRQFVPRVNGHPMMGQPTDIVRVAGKPYLIYECNDYRPNPYRVEFPMRIAVKLIWQDADGAFWFYWDDSGILRDLSSDEDYVRRKLPMPAPHYPNAGIILANDEVMLAAIKSAGAIFRHACLPPAPKPLEVRIGRDLLFNLGKGDMGDLEWFLRRHAWRSGIRLVYDPDGPSKLPYAPVSAAESIRMGEYIRLQWKNARGAIRIDAPSMKAHVGFSGSTIEFGDTRITGINREFSSICIVAEDGLPLADSRSVLVTLACDSTNTGFRFDPSRSTKRLAQGLAQAVVYDGKAPVIYKRVSATITAPWLVGMSFKKFNFARKCYGRGKLSGAFVVAAEEPLFYARLTRPIPKRIRKMLVIGNSITRHGPNAKLGWSGNWGMAATARERDFAHILHRRLCAFQPKPKPQLIIENLLARNLPAQIPRFKRLAAHEADLIIVQIGDNLAESAATEETLGKPYERLLATLKGNRDPLIIGVSTWGRGAKRDRLMEKACRKLGVFFVRIGSLASNPANRAKSEGHFKHSGVNWHPGDRGMKAIADAIWPVIKHELQQRSRAFTKR